MFEYRTIDSNETFQIIRALKDPSILKGYLLSASYFEYNKVYLPERHYSVDSVLISFNHEPLFLLPLIKSGNSCSVYGFPSGLIALNSKDYPGNDFVKSFSVFLRNKFKEGTLIFSPPESLLSEVASGIISSKMIMEASINLELSIDKILEGVRKSYRSLINWGKRNLNIVVYDQNNITKDIMDSFRDLHAKVSGRVTRSEQTWDRQLSMIQNQEAYLVLGLYEEQLVTGVFIQEGLGQAFYGVGVSDRNLMVEKKLPLSHAPLMVAIEEAKKRGNLIFSMGQFDPEETDPKILSITRFKKGFITELKKIHSIEYSGQY